MMAVRRWGSLWVTSAISVVALVAFQIHLSQWNGTSQKIEQFMYLPNGEYLRIASLGYRELVADILWIQAIQVMGERKVSETAGHWLYRAMDIITTLDPKFVRVYEAGGLALTTLVVLPEESNRLLKKGILHNPGEWKLPFLLGINYYFELYDDAKAAEYISEASRLPGAPQILSTLAANLYVAAKSPQQAVDLLSAVYQNTTDENAKQLLEQRLKIVIVERDLQLLEQAIERYQQLHGRLPDRIDDLVGPELLRKLPIEPSGGHYVYDPTTGSVVSSEMKERMKLLGRRRGR
jgi:tetratricopeptide (TPR) repeat protein